MTSSNGNGAVIPEEVVKAALADAELVPLDQGPIEVPVDLVLKPNVVDIVNAWMRGKGIEGDYQLRVSAHLVKPT